MTAPAVRRWDDASAPLLTGEAGSLIALLDAVLVNGYGAQAALGWTKEYLGSNKAAYRNSPVNGTGFYFRFDDDRVNKESAHCRGYESMTDIDTGSGTFPTTDDLFIWKSNSQNSTARPWVVYGDDCGFWLLIYANYTATGGDTYCNIHWIGDFISFVPGDGYASGIGGCVSEGNDNNSYMGSIRAINIAPSTSHGPLYAARPSDGTGANGDNLFKLISGVNSGANRMGQDGIQAAEWNGQVLYSHLGGICDCAIRTYRGKMPGILDCLHDYAFMTDDSVHGDLRYHKFRHDGDSYGGFFIDIISDFR
ncbi:hypothetical protein DRH14_03375 [Candidatus Shapirobacteria bacterium]|nr:MAG: hypothetical protein DRH14_03375 [Candidatus Shapirobacteria bacterium]